MLYLFGAWGYFGYDLIFYGIIAFLLLIPDKYFTKAKLWHLITLLIVVRAGYFFFKLSTGRILFDYDTTYYFNYGRELLAGNYPLMEYPTGALISFGLMSIFTTKIEIFRIIFPIIQLPFGILIILYLNKFGKLLKQNVFTQKISLIYILSPSILWFWFHRYDEFAISFFIISLYYFAINKNIKGTFLSTLGALIKWVPIFSLPSEIILWFKQKKYKLLLQYGGFAILILLILSVPFYVVSPKTFTHTYTNQTSRILNGESSYYSLEGNFANPIPPYGYPKKPFFTNEIILIITIIICILWLLFMIWKVDKSNHIVFSGLTMILFIITNKIFSTQYIVWLIPTLAIIMMYLKKRSIENYILLFVILLLDLTNFIKTPVTPNNWLIFARIFWILIIAIFTYIIIKLLEKTVNKKQDFNKR